MFTFSNYFHFGNFLKFNPLQTFSKNQTKRALFRLKQRLQQVSFAHTNNPLKTPNFPVSMPLLMNRSLLMNGFYSLAPIGDSHQLHSGISYILALFSKCMFCTTLLVCQYIFELHSCLCPISKHRDLQCGATITQHLCY